MPGNNVYQISDGKERREDRDSDTAKRLLIQTIGVCTQLKLILEEGDRLIVSDQQLKALVEGLRDTLNHVVINTSYNIDAKRGLGNISLCDDENN